MDCNFAVINQHRLKDGLEFQTTWGIHFPLRLEKKNFFLSLTRQLKIHWVLLKRALSQIKRKAAFLSLWKAKPVEVLLQEWQQKYYIQTIFKRPVLQFRIDSRSNSLFSVFLMRFSIQHRLFLQKCVQTVLQRKYSSLITSFCNTQSKCIHSAGYRLNHWCVKLAVKSRSVFKYNCQRWLQYF